jgi:hypothetical protein
VISSALEILLESRKLERREYGDDQVVGLWSKAGEAYNDSFGEPRSWNGRFRDLYEAGRLAAAAFAAACGYRPIGEGHHHSVFKAAVALTRENVREAFTAINGLRGTRHDTNYGSADVVDESDVAELRSAIEVVLDSGAKLLRELRPGASARIRVTKPRRVGRKDATS